MFTLSAFADEISPDPREQIAVLKSCRVRFIEFRSIYKTNVLALSDEQIKEFKKLLDDEGFGLSAIGSPIGKVAIDTDFNEHLDKFKRAIELCGVFGTRGIRVFSYYPPGNDPNFDRANWPKYRDEVIRRMRTKAELAAKSNVVLFHENEHRIYGDTPDRVADLLSTVNSPALRAAYDAANYTYGNCDPVEGWEKTKAFTAHLHIKDWKRGGHAAGHEYGVIAGTGDGNIAHSIKGAVAMGYKGYAVLEPHLRGGGPTGGITGPDLFPYAVEAFRAILQKCGGKEG
ncbi:MAG: sugar phosphate isomerase/epimerase [Planctomycetia bacterium]|nr:sugar phosphate isomerase/epimerase [Planctomycetia bacterium]